MKSFWHRKPWIMSFFFLLIFTDGNLLLLRPKIPAPISSGPLPSISYETGSQSDTPPFPSDYRFLHTKNTVLKNHWVLTYPQNANEACHIYMTNDLAPEDEDILGYCGLATYADWVAQQTCNDSTGDGCTGVELSYVGGVNQKLETNVKLPGPLAYVEISNCGAWGICTEKPMLNFGGLEPLHSQHIEKLYVIYETGEVLQCTQVPCSIELPTTTSNGIKIFYYATSSYGDRSLTGTFYMRNISNYQGGYLFQILGDPFWNSIPAAAAQWEFFPLLDSIQRPWLEDVSTVEDLATTEDYSLLAGKLILRGSVSASQCADGGLLQNGAASACGVSAAKDLVTNQQNRFDAQILQAAAVSRIPPRLLKGVIGQESQFWDGWVIKGEYGYGMMTENGADMLLTWNLGYYLDLCLPIYGGDGCAWGYTNLADYPQAYLRGLALQNVGTNREFEVIGQTLAAATGQTGQLIRNITGKMPGNVVSYDELWKISLAVYHGGAGCVGEAIKGAWAAEEEMTWANISEYLQGSCQAVADYPSRVISYSN
ncbi:hypothetical protein KQH54_02205 [bacterium]|nr:hypothetical protein [bacterium]